MKYLNIVVVILVIVGCKNKVDNQKDLVSPSPPALISSPKIQSLLDSADVNGSILLYDQ